MQKQDPIKSLFKARLRLPVLLVALLFPAALSGGTTPVTHAATITADSTDDTVADDGVYTLREVITAANTDTAWGHSWRMSAGQWGRHQRTGNQP